MAIRRRRRGTNRQVVEQIAMDLQKVDGDRVGKPQHYREGPLEAIDEMLMAFGPVAVYDFCVINAWKYRSRAPYKGTPEEDMAKSYAYIQMAHDIIKNNRPAFDRALRSVNLIKTGDGDTEG